MARPLFLILLLAANVSNAAVNVNLELELPGSRTHMAQLEIPDGEWVNLNQPPLKLRVKATPSKDSVAVECQIHETVKGRDVLRGIPTLVTRWDGPAEIAARNNDQSLIYRIKVTPSH